MRSLTKNTIRELVRSPGRFLAILAIIVLGSGFFVGLRVSQKAMTATAGAYLDKTKFFDFSAASSLGFTASDAEAFAADPDVLDAEGGFQTDALVNLGGETDLVYTLYSLPERINLPHVVEGRLPTQPGECLADSRSGLHPGDKVTISQSNDPDTLELFACREFTVTGLATSPLYLNFERGSTSLGTGSVSAFCYILPEAFDADYLTCVYIRCTDMPAPYTDAYNERSQALEERLTDLAQERADARRVSLVSDAEAELADGWEEYNKSLEEYNTQRADAEAELSDAKAQLDDTKAQLDEAESQITQGRTQLQDGLEELQESEKPLTDAKKELDSAKEELDGAERQIQDGLAQAQEGRAELASQQAQGQKELDDAKGALEAARAELDSGEAAYNQGYVQYMDGENQYAAGLAQFNASEESLAQGEAQYAQGLQTFTENRDLLKSNLQTIITAAPLLQLTVPYTTADEFYDALMRGEEAALSALDAGLRFTGDSRTAQEIADALRTAEQTLSSLRAQLDSGRKALEESRATLEATRLQLDGAKEELEDSRRELDSGWQDYNRGLEEYNAAVEEFNSAVSQGEARLDAAEAELAQAQEEYDSGLAAYEDALAAYNQGLSAYNQGKQELEDARRELEEAEAQYADGLAQYREGLQEYEDARAQADQEFADALAQLDDAKEELEDARRELGSIDAAEAYLLGRWSNVGYSCFESDASIVRSISSVFPMFFFLVAALICVTTVTRMVEEQRSQIGVLMALGYSPAAVMGKYLVYSGSAAVLGCAVGIALGSRVIPLVVWQAYKIMYDFSDKIGYYFDVTLSAVTFLLYLAAMLLVTFLACRREIYDVPANVLRPRAPKAGKRVLLERVPFIWNRLSFLWKVTVRNIFRYKLRVAMMILGVAGCTALMLTGMGINDSIKNVVDYQFDEISLYDYTVTFSEELTPEKQAEFLDRADRFADGALFVHQSSFTASANRTEKEVQLNAVETDSVDEIGEFVDFHRGSRKLPFPEDGQALVNSGLAETLNLSVGDKLELRSDDGPSMTLTVSGIYDNYIYNNVYITASTYAAVHGGDPEINFALVTKDPSVDTGEALAAILSMDNVLTASASMDLRERIASMMESLIYIVLLTVICAAALAFVVIYNLTNINIQERLRELATVKVLGFYDAESALYVLRENVLLTVLGAAVGIPLGLALNAFVIGQIDIDLIHFTPRVLLPSYLWSLALTFLFSFLVDLFMSRRLNRIDTAAALKAAE